MSSATAQRIRPNRTAHREWFSTLDADAKSTVKANVQSMIDEGVEQSVAWDKVYDSDQQPAAQQTGAEGAVSDEQQPVDDVLSEHGESLLSDEQAVREAAAELQQHEAPKGSRTISTKAGKLPGHLRTALGGLKSTVDDKGELTLQRGEQQHVVNALRTYLDGDVPDHVAWTIESVIGKVRSMFHRVVDKGDNVNRRAIDAMLERDVQFEVVMRSDGSPTYKVGDVTMSARDALNAHTDAEAQAS